jgi:hypothetical protein
MAALIGVDISVLYKTPRWANRGCESCSAALIEVNKKPTRGGLSRGFTNGQVLQ